MKRSRFSEEQIIETLKQAENGRPIAVGPVPVAPGWAIALLAVGLLAVGLLVSGGVIVRRSRAGRVRRSQR